MLKSIILLLFALAEPSSPRGQFSALCCTHQIGMFVCHNSEVACEDSEIGISCWDQTCRSTSRLLSALIGDGRARCCVEKPAAPNGKAGACTLPLVEDPLPACEPDWVVVCEQEWVEDWPGSFCVP